MEHDKKDFLGRFIRKIELPVEAPNTSGKMVEQKIKFYVRGLTVSEYIDMSEDGWMKNDQVNMSTYMKMAFAGVVDWRGIKEKPTQKNIQELPDEVLYELGRYIFQDLTMLKEEEYEKLKGYVNFLYWRSEDENKHRVENFNCRTCLKKGLAKKRPCGRFSEEEIDRQHKKLNDKIEEDKEDKNQNSVSDALSKYKNKKKTFRSEKEREDHIEKGKLVGKKSIRMKEYNFEECPVSWIDNWLKELGGVLYHCHSHELSFFEGGVANQPYKMYRALKVVGSEVGKLEKIEMDKDMDN